MGSINRMVVEQIDRNRGGDRRSTHIDQIVADENGWKQPVGVVLHFLYQLIDGSLLFGQMNCFGFADGKQGGFSRGEKSGEQKQDEQKHKLIELHTVS